MKIYLREMPCIERKSNSRVEKIKDHFYDLSSIYSNELQQQLRGYILERGQRICLKSMDDEIYMFNRFRQFLDEELPNITDLRQIELQDIVKKYKAWHLKNGFPITRHHSNNLTLKDVYEESDYIKYVRRLFQYLEPDDTRPEVEKDIWNLESLGFEVRQNPIAIRRKINFTGILQKQIREEMKLVCQSVLKYKALNTVIGEIRTVKNFSCYLKDAYPNIQSLKDVDRKIIEAYITYRNTEKPNKSLSTEFANLKVVLQLVGKLLEQPHLEQLFIKRDIPKTTKPLFRFYSDEELERLNNAVIKYLDKQLARIWILHQLLGGRSSDVLTLHPDCLYNVHGQHILRIYQVKTVYYEKPITQEIADLISRCIEDTYEKFGETPYIFVNGNNLDRPISKRTFHKKMQLMINQNDIRRDNGEIMPCSTLMLRHTYGVKLADLHIDDATIAKLLGHRGISSVHHYRRTSGQILVKETDTLRKTMDKILSEIIKEWEGYEQIFQDG